MQPATVTLPAWVVPPPGQVRDAHRLEQAAWRSGKTVGGCAALAWILGQGTAPVSARRDALTPELVRAEMMLGDCVAAGRWWGMTDDVWRSLGVPPAEAAHVNSEYGLAASRALAWVLGATTVPPVALPRRAADGAALDAEALYAEKASTRYHLLPEVRAQLRAEADREAARYRELVRIADAQVI